MNHSGRSIVRLVLCLGLLGFPTTVWGQIPNYGGMVVFGDSLSDTGNAWLLSTSLGLQPALPPSESPHKTYFHRRFSNGPIVFEHLWDSLNPNGGPVLPSLAVSELPPRTAVSFAFGTSGTDANCTPVPGLLCQVALFAQSLGGNPPPKRTLYAVLSGSTDVLNAPNPFDPAVVAGIVTNVKLAVQQLYLLGARDVIVVNMPNLGLSPLIQSPDVKAGLNQVAQQHNAALASALADLSTTLPEIRIIPVDVYTHVQTLVATSSFNFVTPALDPVNAMCLFDGAVPQGSNCQDVPTFHVDRSYFFWDVEHPTKAAHADIGGLIYRTLKAFFAR